MEPYEITRAGESETAKGLIHLAIFGLAVTAGCYNLVTLQARPSRHLAANAIVYAALAAFEAHHVVGHMRR